MDEDILRKLEERLGPLHARQRLGIETDHEAQIFGQGLLSFHIVNWYPVHSVIRNALKLTGLYWRGRRNTGSILVKRNDVMFKELPPLFDGFTILHLSDMHVDMNEAAMQRLIELVGDLRYDLCVLTGDYRGKNLGPFEATLTGVARVRAHLKGARLWGSGRPRYHPNGSGAGSHGNTYAAQRERGDRARRSANLSSRNR